MGSSSGPNVVPKTQGYRLVKWDSISMPNAVLETRYRLVKWDSSSVPNTVTETQGHRLVTLDSSAVSNEVEGRFPI